MKVAIYTRISSDPSGERLGVQRQLDACRALCDARGWTVAAVYEDDDRSAYSGKPRPGYIAMLENVAAGTVGAIVAWHPDRLHRSPRELEDFIDLVERTKIEVVTVSAGAYDLNTSAGRMSARVVGAVARGESELKSERAKAKARQLATAGKNHGGGTRPFGFEPDRVTIRQSEAELIREAVSRFLAGSTIRSLCADWNARGIPTVSGAPWRTMVMRRLISSPRNAGWREHHGELITEAEWPAIIPLDDHHAVNVILSDPTRRKNRNPRRYLLTGFLFCRLCEEKLIARPTSDKRKKYVCSGGVNFTGCGKLSCIAKPLDDLVSAAVLEVVRGIDLTSHAVVPEVDLAEVLKLEARMDELAAMFAEGLIGQREWLTARESIDARLAALRSEESVALGHRSARADVAALQASETEWDELDVIHQRAVVELFVDAVWLDSAVAGRNFFDPSRVDINWRV